MADWAELMERGKALYLAGDYAASTHAFRDAAGQRPNSAETWRALGFALMSSGNPPDAIAAFRSVLDLAPEDADAHYGLGLVMAESGDLGTAVQWFDKTLALKSGHGRAKASLVATLVKQGDLAVRAGDRKAAEPHYARACQLKPASIETVQPYCDNLVELGRYKEAWDAANNARKLAPNDHALRELFEVLDTDPRITRAKRENSLI